MENFKFITHENNDAYFNLASEEYLLKQSESQLLITTHYSGLFNTINDLIRKDNIWFVEKGKNGSTDLFSLVEFKGLNKVTQFERVYRKGMFGALPNIMN